MWGTDEKIFASRLVKHKSFRVLYTFQGEGQVVADEYQIYPWQLPIQWKDCRCPHSQSRSAEWVWWEGAYGGDIGEAN